MIFTAGEAGPCGQFLPLRQALPATAGFASSSNQWTDAQRWLLSISLFAYPFVVLGMAFVLLTRDGKK